jgi:chromosome segregation ATPase
MRAIDTNLAELRKGLEPIAGLNRALGARVEEDQRLSRAIDELRAKIQELRRIEEEYTRTYRLIEDGRRQDAKRLVDLQGEITAMRKRVDEQRGQIELLSTNLRKYETRLNEIATQEAERREEQIAFLEKQALAQVERDRTWKEWQVRFETIEKQSADLESQLQSLETTHLMVKRAQETLNELAERVERRMNEITEMQRLTEERFRQEWTTFKADDQKRWANYTLVQEEQRNEFKRQMEKLSERLTHVEDSLQELQDMLFLMNEHSEKQLQSLLAMVHEWAEAYERAFSHLR